MEVTNSNKKPRAAVYLRKSTIDDRPGENRSFARQITDMEKIIPEFGVVYEFREEIGMSAGSFSDQERLEGDNGLAGLGFDVLICKAKLANA